MPSSPTARSVSEGILVFDWISFSLDFFSFFVVVVGLFQARSSITVVESLRNPPPANLASGADGQVTESCGFFFLTFT